MISGGYRHCLSFGDSWTLFTDLNILCKFMSTVKGSLHMRWNPRLKHLWRGSLPVTCRNKDNDNLDSRSFALGMCDVAGSLLGLALLDRYCMRYRVRSHTLFLEVDRKCC